LKGKTGKGLMKKSQGEIKGKQEEHFLWENC
jgi:hypothetical protein